MTPTHFQRSLAGMFPTNTGDDDEVVPVTQGSAANYLSRGSGRFTQPVLQPVLHIRRAFVSQVSRIHTSGLCCCTCALRVGLRSKWARQESCWVLVNIFQLLLIITFFFSSKKKVHSRCICSSQPMQNKAMAWSSSYPSWIIIYFWFAQWIAQVFLTVSNSDK